MSMTYPEIYHRLTGFRRTFFSGIVRIANPGATDISMIFDYVELVELFL
jgi:hypothetical protein